MFAPGLLVAVRRARDRIVAVAKAMNFTKSPYNAYIGAWGSVAPQVPNGSWDQSWIITANRFPDRTSLDWHYADGQTFEAVAGYSKISFMNGDATAPLAGAIVPRQIFNITKLKVRFNWSFTGSPNFNLLAEAWAAPYPRPTGEYNSSGNSFFEIAFWPYTSDLTWFNLGTLVGTFTDSDGVEWIVRHHPIPGYPAKLAGTTPGKYIIAYTPNKFAGTLHYDEFFDFLIAKNLITGAEWYAGDDFGIEQINGGGAGTWTVESLSHQYEHKTGADFSYLPGPTINAAPTDLGSGWWNVGGVTRTLAQPDAAGGTSAARFLETAVTDNHTVFEAEQATIAREADYMIAISAKLIGRTYCAVHMYKSDYSAGVAQAFNFATDMPLPAGGGSVSNLYGGFSVLQAQLVAMQSNGFKGIMLRVRKPAGVSAVHLFFETLGDDGVSRQYAGDTGKGFALHEIRVVQDPRLIIAGTPGNATLFTAYSYAPATVRGGSGALAWTISAGTLPAGLALNAGTGQITGTPTTQGASNGIVLTATDANGQAASIGPFNIVVAEPANIAQTNLTNASVIKTAATVTNANTATQGFLETATNAQHNVSQSITGQSASAGQYRAEFNVGAIGGRSHCHIYLAQANDAANAIVIVDLAGGTIAQATYTGLAAAAPATIAANGDGTFKVVIRITWPANQATIKWRVQAMSSSGTFSFLGEMTKGVMLRNDYKLQRTG